MNKGIWYAISAYTLWGLLPIYWKCLHNVPALQLLGHRILWSFIFLSAILALKRRWKTLIKTTNLRILVFHVVAACLLSMNWLTYVWAVNAGFIVETSLGYFINPLLSVLLGVLFIGEHLRFWQWVAAGLAGIGVLYLTIIYGSIPWIALTLALTFAFYGLVKKKARLGSIDGLTLETAILLLPTLLYLFFIEKTGQGAFFHEDLLTHMLLVGAGPITTIPLVLFAMGARRTPLFLIGITQYIAPTLQFLIGVLMYHEPFSSLRFIGFGIIWSALIIFAAESIWVHRIRMSKKK